jgi:hypothetical protein
MPEEQKTDEAMKMEDSVYNQSVLLQDLFKKIREQDAMIALQKENMALLKRQLALQDIIFDKHYEFICQMQQSRYLSGNMAGQAAATELPG